MASVKLHFSVFGHGCARGGDGTGMEGHHSICIEDPLITTIGALKKQLFREECEEHKSIRFIARGRVLEDKVAVGQCALGEEAHIHVAISGRPAENVAVGSATAMQRPMTTEAASGGDSSASRETGGGSGSLNLSRILGAVLLAGAGLLFCLAWQRRRRLSLRASQVLCILAAGWVYLAIFHALPAMLRLLGSGLSAALRGSPKVSSDRAGSLPEGTSSTAVDAQRESSATLVARGQSD